jgi:hypothetical protein
MVPQRLNYYRRVFAAYLTPAKSQLTFWHEVPEVNDRFRPGELGEYYMTFSAKADYPGHYDQAGIPMLNYHGTVGLQYNPIAIAQYSLGNYNRWARTRSPQRRHKFLAAADWLVGHLEQNPAGLWVWNHHFDWEYRTRLKAPWYSALSQGQGLSALVRAHRETGDDRYLAAAGRAFETFLKPMDQGGVIYVDDHGYTWFEETIVDPPTHILNGFLWAAWGIYDYRLHTASLAAERLFREAVHTLKHNLRHFDVGFWSLYEQSGTRLRMLASPFYHRLHIVQLQVMHRLTGDRVFLDFARRWETYRRHRVKRSLALTYKAVFKVLYY